MAYIHDSNAPTRNLRVPGMERSIDIPANGVRQVRAAEADLLVEYCPTITHHDPSDD